MKKEAKTFTNGVRALGDTFELRLAFVFALVITPAGATIPGMEGGRATWLGTLQAEAARRHVPAALADAVAMIETGYRPDAIGTSGEIGMMQVMPATARQLGFTGTLTELFAPETNIALGVEYLSRAWALSGGNVCRALMKYRAGLGQEIMTPLSARYCERGMAWLAGTGSHLGAGTAMPDDMPAPVTATDPYVIAIVPALAAQNRLRPIEAVAHEMVVSYAQQHQTMAQRNAALEARFNSHQRHMSSVGRVQDAVDAALAEPQE